MLRTRSTGNTKLLGLLFFILISGGAPKKASAVSPEVVSNVTDDFSQVLFYWEPVNPWQKIAKLGRASIYENGSMLGYMGYGTHAFLHLRPGNRVFLVTKSEYDGERDQKIVIPLRLEEGDRLTVTFSQDRHRSQGIWKQPVYSTEMGLSKPIAQSERAFVYLEK